MGTLLPKRSACCGSFLPDATRKLPDATRKDFAFETDCPKLFRCACLCELAGQACVCLAVRCPAAAAFCAVRAGSGSRRIRERTSNGCGGSGSVRGVKCGF